MEKLLPVLLSASLLTACGGSGGGSSPQPSTPTPAPAPTPAPNEAPTISGTFTLNAKAAQSNKIVLNTADKENDQLSFSIANKPEWVSFRLTDNQLELDFQPGFFDIDDYQLKFRISDGKDATEYDFNLVVEDNRDQWQEIDMTEAETIGIWSNTKENTRFVFLSNKTGLHTKEGESKPLSWSSPDTIDMRLYNLGCFQNGCSQQDFLEMSVVAQEQDRIRVRILNNDNNETVLNLVKEQSVTNQHKYYIPLFESGIHNATIFNAEANTIDTVVALNTLSLGEHGLTNYGFRISTAISLEDGFYRANNNEPILLPGQVSVSFRNNVTNDFNQISFNAFADNITVTILESGLLTTSADIRLELASDLSPYSASDYFNLPTTIPVQQASNILQAVSKTSEQIQLVPGNSYSGLLIPESRIIGDTEYLSGGATYKILDDTQGEVTLNVVGTDEQETHNFTWQLDNNTLSVMLNGVESKHDIISLPNNNLGLTTSFERSDGSSGANIYGFNQVSNGFSRQDYLGKFRHAFFSVFDDTELILILNDDSRGKYTATPDSSSDFIDDYWKYEDDGSVSITGSFGCDNAINYDQCLSAKLANPNVNTTVRNIKLISINGDTYKFHYSFFAKFRDGSQRAFQSIRYFQKITE
ncbi:hypothetical protein J7384_06200 [Endozoicomonas sp. G2_1]|uniref:hypothetical protein n=1 Tax=Endozoicomonas sp. G2_1 TaxID=2821091 RepID=UPI001ADC5F6E|nr:hypothetical protein [Endozoicomonas sp. G2_1]MBO9489948.1 hypothetical protein [Endozoicomonas sp. G2_1]